MKKVLTTKILLMSALFLHGYKSFATDGGQEGTGSKKLNVSNAEKANPKSEKSNPLGGGVEGT
jgi:hypothetical protein